MHATRILRSAVSAAALTLTLAPAAQAHRAPRPDTAAVVGCAPIARTGTYRISYARGKEIAQQALLVLERAGSCQSAMIVTEQSSAVLYLRSMDENGLTATMRTESGMVEVSMKFEGDRVTGALVRGKKNWAIDGQKSS